MEDWFRFGSKVGRFVILRARRHGARIQRYDAHDSAMRKPVIITCAMPERAAWASKFEEMIAERAALQHGSKIVGWGITHENVFFIAEENLGANPPSTLRLQTHISGTFFYAVADELGDFAEEGFLHGALEPGETIGVVDGEPIIYGAGFRQILGCMDGAGVLESEFTAPEMLEGKAWNERADVFSMCAIWASMWSGQGEPEDAWSRLDVAGVTLKQGLAREINERPGWALVNLVFTHGIERMVEATCETDGHKTKGRRETTRARAIADEWAKVRPANEVSSKLGSDKRRKDPNAPASNSPELELFVDWEIDHQFAFGSDGIEVFMCQPFASDDVHVLRRVRPASMNFALVSPEKLGDWKEKRKAAQQVNMPPFVGAGISDDGWVYWVEAYAGAITLPHWMKESNGAKAEQLNASKAILEAGRVLEACAAHGLFHGDLEAERDLIFADDGTLCVLGIGALQAFGMQGIPSKSIYAAPERRTGAEFDHRADIYALAAILCECVTGCVPAPKGGSHPAADLKWWLREVIMHATEKDPALRFATWADFLAALERCIRAYGDSARKSTKGRARATKAASPAKKRANESNIDEALCTVLRATFEQAPKTSDGTKPSSSDPRPSPAPQGRPAAEAVGPDVPKAEAVSAEGPKAERGEKLAATLASVELDRITLPSPIYVSAPSNQQRPAKWIGAGFGLVAGVAACFALLWSARVPALAPLEEVHSAVTFEARPVYWTVSTAERERSSESVNAAPVPRGARHRTPSENRERAASAPQTNACRLGFCMRGGAKPVEPR